jgi:hypothetical protein
MGRRAFSAVAAAALIASSSKHTLAQLPGNIPQTWQLNRSTINMPCNNTGSLDRTVLPFGIVDIDWSNMKGFNGVDGWAAAKPMSCEEDLVVQANLLKAADPDKVVWVYR